MWGGGWVVVGLWDFHPQWYGLEHGSGPPTPLLTTVLSWGRKPAQVFTQGTPVIVDIWAVERVGIAPLNVSALEVIAPSPVAFSQGAVPPRLVHSGLGVERWAGPCVPVPGPTLSPAEWGPGQWCRIVLVYRWGAPNMCTTLASRVAQLSCPAL